GVHDGSHARRGGALDHLIAVAVEFLAVDVRVRVDHFSMRGKSGFDSPSATPVGGGGKSRPSAGKRVWSSEGVRRSVSHTSAAFAGMTGKSRKAACCSAT